MDDQRLARWLGSDLFDRPGSRRTALKGLVALLAAGAVAPLAAACTSQPPAPAAKTDAGPAEPPKPAEAAKPAAPAATTAPAPAVAAKPAEAPKPAGQPKSGGTLKIAITGDPPSFDPMFTTSGNAMDITWHNLEHLFEAKANQDAGPFLVDKYDASSDGKKWVLNLRKGVPFHNDKEMTSADVVASLKRYGGMAARGKFVFQRLDTIDAPDKYTVTLSFKTPMGALPLYLSQSDAPIIPEEIAARFPNDPLPAQQIIGTGPYKFLEHVPDRQTRLGRFDKYVPMDAAADGPWGKRVAYVDEIRFMPVSEDSVRADGAATGEYHFADVLRPDQFDSVKASPNVTPIIGKPFYWYCPRFNLKQGLMTDVRLRQAVLALGDMEPLLKATFGRPDFYRMGPDIAAIETAWYSDEGKEVYNKVDPEKAKILMKEAGYNGQTVRWITSKEYFWAYNMALPYKQLMEQAGFKVELEVMDYATLIKRRADPKEFDIFSGAHPSFVHPALQTYVAPTWPGWWESEVKDKIINDMLAEPDQSKHKELTRQLQAQQWKDLPCIKVGEGFNFQSRRNELNGYANWTRWFFWNTWLS